MLAGPNASDSLVRVPSVSIVIPCFNEAKTIEEIPPGYWVSESRIRRSMAATTGPDHFIRRFLAEYLVWRGCRAAVHFTNEDGRPLFRRCHLAAEPNGFCKRHKGRAETKEAR